MYFLSVVILLELLGSGSGSWPALRSGYSWSNLAWGFSDGGSFVDKDYSKIISIDTDYTNVNVTKLHDNNQLIQCYLSIGTVEPWRPNYNATEWTGVTLGKMTDWNEFWIDIRKSDLVVPIIQKRIDILKLFGCDILEPDNMDCYDNIDCYSKMTPTITRNYVMTAQIKYVNLIANYTHSIGMSIVVKNSVDIIPQIYNNFDGVVIENCIKYDECDIYKKYFVDNNKVALAVEYNNKSTVCSKFPTGFSGKKCVSNKAANLCKSGNWINCYNTTLPLPPTVYI